MGRVNIKRTKYKMLIKEIDTIKPLTPEKARIEALKRQKDNANKALKAERDNQRIAKAQKQLRLATTPHLQ